MTDIVERLRDDGAILALDAAEEIERLCAENEKLRAHKMTNNQDDWMSVAIKREAEIERLRAEIKMLRELIKSWRLAGERLRQRVIELGPPEKPVGWDGAP